MAIKEHFEGKRDLGLIDPRKLTVDPDYNIRDLDKPEAREGLDYLKSLIRATGVQTPLRVREDGDGKLIIVRGHRRHKVVLELIEEGHPVKNVPAMQEPRGTTPADRNWDLIDSNSEEPLKGFERAEVIYRQIHVFGWSEEEILRRTGKTKQWLDQQLDLRSIDPRVKQMVDDKAVSLTTARIVTKEHGAEAPAILKAAAETAKVEARDKPGRKGRATPRATPRAVAKVTGHKSRQTKDNERLIDFVAVANKMDDAVKLAGGINKVEPDKVKALLSEAIATRDKAMGRRVDVPADAACETDRATFDEQNPETTAVHPSAPETPVAVPEPPSGPDETITHVPMRFATSPGDQVSAHQRPGIKALIDALKPFAELCNDIDMNQLRDDEVIEVFARDAKRAWAVYNAATGGTQEGEAA